MARTPRKIEFTELADSLKDFIQAGAKIFPIESYESLPTSKDKDFYKVMSGEWKNYIFAWYPSENSYKPIGADDRHVSWEEITYKPQEFPPTTHTHSYTLLDDIPAEFTPSSHTHLESEITNLDKYSTIDVDSKFSLKSDTGHIHLESEITDLDKYTKFEIDSIVSGKVDKVSGKMLTSNDYIDVDKQKLSDLHASATFDYTTVAGDLEDHKTSSDHDGRYYTKTALDTTLSAKADKSTVNGHTGNTTIHVTQTNKDDWDAKAEVSYVDDGLSTKVDTVIGKGLSSNDYTTTEKDKLAGVDTGANNYSHPANHPPNIITEDLNNRFVTDAQISTWSGKWDYDESVIKAVKVDNATSADNADTVNNKTVLTSVPLGAVFTDTVYSHPSSHPASMITESTTKRFVTDTEKSIWSGKAEISDIPTAVSAFTNDANYVTDADLGEAGLGDMLKSTYDIDNNGVVDDSEKLAGNTLAQVRSGTTKSDVGLSNVDNIQQLPLSQKGANSGVATLDTSGNVPETQLPSSALVGDTTYSAGTGLSLTGGEFAVTTPFNSTGTYPGLRAQATTNSDVGLGNVSNNLQATKTELDGHTTDSTIHFSKTDVTKSDVGLSNLDNIQQATKSEFNTHVESSDIHFSTSYVEDRMPKTAMSLPASPIAGQTIYLEV